MNLRTKSNILKNYHPVSKIVLSVMIFAILLTSSQINRLGNISGEIDNAKISFETTNQDDAGSGGDAGDIFDNATHIDFDTYFCSLPDDDFDDFFEFYLGHRAEVTIEIGSLAGDINFKLFNAYGVLISSQISASRLETYCANFTSGSYIIQAFKETTNYFNITYFLDLKETIYSNVPTNNQQTTINYGNGNLAWIVPILLVFLLIGVFLFITITKARANKSKQKTIIKNPVDYNKINIETKEIKDEQILPNFEHGYSFSLVDEDN